MNYKRSKRRVFFAFFRVAFAFFMNVRIVFYGGDYLGSIYEGVQPENLRKYACKAGYFESVRLRLLCSGDCLRAISRGAARKIFESTPASRLLFFVKTFLKNGCAALRKVFTKKSKTLRFCFLRFFWRRGGDSNSR